MTSPSPVKPNPLAAILVYGAPSGPELTQASWFKAEDKQVAKAAAAALKFSVIELQTDAEKALTIGVREGVLKGGGRMIVGSVAAEVSRRIDEYVRKASGGEVASKPGSVALPGVKPASEQITNTSAAGAVATSSAPTSAASPSADETAKLARLPAAPALIENAIRSAARIGGSGREAQQILECGLQSDGRSRESRRLRRRSPSIRR